MFDRCRLQARHSHRAHRWTVCAAAALVAGHAPVVAHALAADRCVPQATDGELVTLAAALPDGRLRLADGRIVRLAGLDLGSLVLVEPRAGDATLLAPVAADRHGDWRGDLVVEGPPWSEGAVAEGSARVRPGPGDEAGYGALLAAEAKARAAGLGLWADPGYAIIDASDPVAVARQEGRFTIMSGRVRHVGTTRDQVWIDFGDQWRSDVTVVVPRTERSRFVAAGLDAEALEGRSVRVRGVVTLREGPRIEVTEPAAIERLPD